MAESIKEILDSMRETADRYERKGIYDLRHVGTDELRVWADLIETGLGNAAEMRAALRGLLAWLDKHGDSYTYLDGTPADEVKAIWQRRQEIVSRARAALAAPPRNCDRFGSYEALRPGGRKGGAE